MKRLIVVLSVTVAFMFSLLVSTAKAQEFGRSAINNPCPQPDCLTAKELEMRIVQLETQLAHVTALLANVTRYGNDITFSGVNVHIVDGSGDTGGTVNGLGNLIVGYNELRGDGSDSRIGSHNIVVGTLNNYSDYGGLVVGFQNTISGPYASVSGGSNNTASGEWASVSGGSSNTASDVGTSVSGGYLRLATDPFDWAAGGLWQNE